MPSGWREESSVNGGGWADTSLKLSGQMGTMEGVKWSTISTAPRYRAPAEPQRWGRETQGTTSACNNYTSNSTYENKLFNSFASIMYILFEIKR